MAKHLLNRDGNYYFVRRVPNDLKNLYAVKRLCFILKSKSYSSALPMYNSFVLHHAEGSYCKLKEVMRKAHYERFKSNIYVSKEIFVEQASDVSADKNGFLSMEVDDILNAEKEYSQ